VEVGSLTCCSVLVAEHLATIHNGASRTVIAWATAVVATSVAAAAVSRTAPPMLGPVLLALLTTGLLHADTPRLAMLGFAFAASLPITVVAALGARPRSAVFRAVAFASVAAILARHLFRDPFRERRCLPACVTNPDLITRAPDVVRLSEIVLAVVSLTVVPITAQRVWTTRRSGAVAVASLALCGLLTVWALRLLRQPRPVPDDNTDRVVFVVEVAAVVLAAAAHGWASVDLVLTRRRIRRFTRSLSDAGDLAAITARIRTAVGEPDLEVELGEDARRTGPSGASTTVVRGGRTVATIHHRPGSRGRVAAAVTPSIALALETQLVLSDAKAQVVELERSRAASVRLTDESRRSLERNLHDGAQQRLLVVGMQLANAAQEGPIGSQRRSAASLVGDALRELRRIGRGDAAIIAELGLADAVTAHAGSSDLPVRTQTLGCGEADHDCWSLTTATTAYRLLVAAIVEAQQSAATGLSAVFRCFGAGQGRTVSIEHDGAPAADRSSQRDRVLAAGGRIDSGDSTGSTFKVWLP
jgi:hypothetical protein